MHSSIKSQSPGLGDAPAQAIIEKNRNAKLLRNATETREELISISNRVENTLHEYENVADYISLNSPNIAPRQEGLFRRGSIDSTLEFVDDLAQLTEILTDPVIKRKYQQQVAIFVVGYENVCGDRLELLSQINDSLYNYNNDQIPAVEYPDFDVEHVGRYVNNTLRKAVIVQTKLKDVGDSVAKILKKMNADRRKSSKKRTEKELVQMKEQILSVTEKLISAQQEIEETNEKMLHAYRTLEVKQVEIERLKTQIDASKKKVQDIETLRTEMDEKDSEIAKLVQKNEALKTTLNNSELIGQSKDREIEEAKEKQNKLMSDHQKETRFLNEQILTARRDVENFYEKKLNDFKEKSKEELDEEKTISKKKLASMDSTIRELRTELTKARSEKEEAVNNILTQQAQNEIKNKNKSYETSVERIVKYEKELKASHNKNRELENIIQEEEEKKRRKKKKEKRFKTKNVATDPIPSTVSFDTQSIGTQANEVLTDDVKPLSNDDFTVSATDKQSVEETQDSLMDELAEVTSKFNQKKILAAKLMDEQQKFMKDRMELLEKVELANNVKEEIEIQLQRTLRELEEVRRLYEDSTKRPALDGGPLNGELTLKQVETADISIMTSPLPFFPSDEKPRVVTPFEHATTENVTENDQRQQQQTRFSSAKSRASSLSSVARYQILESCLHHHPMLQNIKESYVNILQLKSEVVSMLNEEGNGEEYEKIIQDTSLEEIDHESLDEGSVADMILKMAVNSSRILTTLQRVIPSLAGKEDLNLSQSSTRLQSPEEPNKKPSSKLTIHLENQETSFSLSPTKDKEIQKDVSMNSSAAKSNSSKGKLADDYRALIHRHSDLEQNFNRLKKQYESNHRAQQHVLSNNAATIQEMETTINHLRNQLRETIHSNFKQEEYIFTRNDAVHNKSTLRQGVRLDQVEESTLEETKAIMEEYISIPVKRWEQFVKRYLHRTRLNAIKKLFEKSSHKIKVNISQMEEVQRQQDKKDKQTSERLSEERMQLARKLIDGLDLIESSTGVFLIKPIATMRKDRVDEKQARREPPLPPVTFSSKRMDFPPLASKSLERSQQEGLQLWKPFSSTEDLSRPVPFNSQLRIPRLLELDVNRPMYSENNIVSSLPPSSFTKNKDNQLNLISYMTVERPGGLGGLEGNTESMIGSEEGSIAVSIKRPTSLPALKSRLSMVTEGRLLDEYRRSVSTWTSEGERRITESPMIRF